MNGYNRSKKYYCDSRPFIESIKGHFFSRTLALIHDHSSIKSVSHGWCSVTQLFGLYSILFYIYWDFLTHQWLILGTCDGGIFTYEKTTGHFLRTAQQESLVLETQAPGITLGKDWINFYVSEMTIFGQKIVLFSWGKSVVNIFIFWFCCHSFKAYAFFMKIFWGQGNFEFLFGSFGLRKNLHMQLESWFSNHLKKGRFTPLLLELTAIG